MFNLHPKWRGINLLPTLKKASCHKWDSSQRSLCIYALVLSPSSDSDRCLKVLYRVPPPISPSTPLTGDFGQDIVATIVSTPPAPTDILGQMQQMFSDLEARFDSKLDKAVKDLQQDASTSTLDNNITMKVEAAVQSAVANSTITVDDINEKVNDAVDAVLDFAVDVAVDAKITTPVEVTARDAVAALNLPDMVNTKVDNTLKAVSADKFREILVNVSATDPHIASLYETLQRALFSNSARRAKADVDLMVSDFDTRLATSLASFTSNLQDLEASVKKECATAVKKAQDDAYLCNMNADRSLNKMLAHRGLPDVLPEDLTTIPLLVAKLTTPQTVWHAGGDMAIRTITTDDGATKKTEDVLGATAYFGTATLHQTLLDSLQCDPLVLMRVKQCHSRIEQANYSTSADRRLKRIPIKSNDAIKDDLLPRLKPPITPASLLDWYDALVRMLIQYNVGLLPFDAINVWEYGHHAFILPGIGYQRFLDMDDHLYLVLEHLLPGTGSFAGLLSRNDGSGTNVLYHLLCEERGTSYLDKDHILTQPKWDDCRGDINVWAKLVKSYHRFLHVRRDPTSDAATGKALPHHLHIMNLAKTCHL
eukprot:scaffold34577_cov82-Skeletonema_dohrnii-CCMP3373.AAC.2